MENNLAAVIEISPTAVAMSVFQRKGNVLESLEEVSEPLLLFDGLNSYRVSFKRVHKLCDVLNKMKELANTYGIENFWVSTTSSFSEVENVLFLVDLVELRTGLKIYVPTVLEKKKLAFKNFLLENRNKNLHTESDYSLIVHIGARTTDITILNGEEMVSHEILNTGNLKLSDTLENQKVNLKKAGSFVRDVLGNYLMILKQEFKIKKIDKLFFLGDFSTNFLNEILQDKELESNTVCKKKLLKKILDLKAESFSALSSSYGISEKEFKKNIASAFFLSEFSDFFEVENIYYIHPDAKWTFAYLKFFKSVSNELEKIINNYSIECAKRIGEKYFYNKEHSEFLLKNCKRLFNKLKSTHKFSAEQLHFLKMAAIFHDIGKFVSFREHHKHSYYLVKESSVFGLNEKELQIVASLCYYHNIENPDPSLEIFNEFSSSEKVVIMKLTAILKLLVSIDRSKKQKFSDISYIIDGSKLVVEVSTDEDFSVEKWSFSRRNKFFKEVFGLMPTLKAKRRYLEDVF